jgi:hypothetical protein
MESGSDVESVPAGGRIFRAVPVEPVVLEEKIGDPPKTGGRLGRDAGSLVSQECGINRTSKRNQE